ncbi:hypothetical protein [Tenacibaculum xiamenense]|uniref:hypothetical protein n=1 Tax=Tenacibaculum xiamenense TaxID=1261553 RepID=UPI003893E5D6
MSEISKFFGYVSWRLRKENDLSDITWAFCESSLEFRNIFLSFFFEEEDNNWSNISDFQREYSRGSSRSDFYFKNDGQEYIIEVKINDPKQHFLQYVDDFPNAKRGYITNYELEEHEGYKITTWKGFRNALKNEHLNKNGKIDQELLKGYITYLENVCLIKEIKKMKLEGIQSLYSFLNSLDEVTIISKKSEEDKINFTSQQNGGVKITNAWVGKPFMVRFENFDFEVKGSIGLYYDNRTEVSIEFSDKELCDVLRLNERNINQNFKWKHYYSEYDKAYFFELFDKETNRFESFDEEDDKAKQINILKEFFIEVIEYVGEQLVYHNKQH